MACDVRDVWAIIHRNLDVALQATRIVDEDSGDTLTLLVVTNALRLLAYRDPRSRGEPVPTSVSG